MASRDYWWRCNRCDAAFEHLEPYQAYDWRFGKRQRVVVYDCALRHEADNPGHRCTRRAGPAV